MPWKWFSRLALFEEASIVCFFLEVQITRGFVMILSVVIDVFAEVLAQ